jgi:hypothetical protein
LAEYVVPDFAPIEVKSAPQAAARNCCLAIRGFHMAKVIDFLFGCPHDRTTFPITLKSSKALKTAQAPAKPVVPTTYIVCLDCGQEFPYDWQQMKLAGSAKTRAA